MHSVIAQQEEDTNVLKGLHIPSCYQDGELTKKDTIF